VVSAAATASWSGGPSELAHRLVICVTPPITADLNEGIVLSMIVHFVQTLLHGLCAAKQSQHHEKKAHCFSDTCHMCEYESEKTISDLRMRLSQKGINRPSMAIRNPLDQIGFTVHPCYFKKTNHDSTPFVKQRDKNMTNYLQLGPKHGRKI